LDLCSREWHVHAQDLLMEKGRPRLLEPLVSCMSRELGRLGVEDGAQARLSQLQAACEAAGVDAGASPQVRSQVA
jgi:hypothetical protein